MRRIVRKIISIATFVLLISVSAYAQDLNTRLIEAAKDGDTAAVKELVVQGADINAKNKYGKTALMWAARDGHTEIAKMLLSQGADVNAKAKNGWTALSEAAKHFHTEIVRLLKQAGAEE